MLYCITVLYDFISYFIVLSYPAILAAKVNKTQCVDHTVVTLQIHHTRLNLVSVHQRMPPLTGSGSILLIYRPQEDEKLSWLN